MDTKKTRADIYILALVFYHLTLISLTNIMVTDINPQVIQKKQDENPQEQSHDINQCIPRGIPGHISCKNIKRYRQQEDDYECGY